MIDITRTELETFMRCGKKYDYAFLRGLKDQEVTKPVMAEGILGHHGLAEGYKYGTNVKDFKYHATRGMAEMIRTGTSVYRGQPQPLGLKPENDAERITTIGDAVQYYADQKVESDFQQYDILYVEKEFETVVKLNSGRDVRISGVLDLVAYDKTYYHKKVVTIFDHKFPGRIPTEEGFLKLNLQLFMYEYLVWKALVADTGKYDDVELQYNMIRREVPPGYGSRELIRNKDGSISKKNASMEPGDYLKRVKVIHSDKQRLAIFNNMLEPLLEEFIGAKIFNRRVIDNGGYACSNCAYFDRCASDLIGMGTPKLVAVS